MRRNKKKKYAYRPSDKVVSRSSALSSILGAGGVLGYILLIYCSFLAAGNGGAWFGLMGWLLLAVSVAGMYLGVKSFQDTAAMARWKIVGVTTNGVTLAVSAVIFILGII